MSTPAPHASALLALAVGSLCWCTHASAQATTSPALAPATQSPTPSGPARIRDAAGNVAGPGRAGWWNDAVFYEVFVRSFKDSSSGPLAGDGIGDIAGLIEKLDYLNDGDPKTSDDLGVTALWLMPINPSPSYHGYDVTDYYGVNPQYGTMDDLKKLMAECHKRGIKVIFDLVLNHCSDQNPWFTSAAKLTSDKHDWFIWSDTDPGWKGPWGQRVWHKTDAGGMNRWYYGLFSAKMPDLNYRNPAVSAEMLRVVDFWLDKSHGIAADGYRLDAIRHLIEDGQVQENTPETHEWLKKFHAECRKVSPGAVSIGEVWSSSEIASTYVGDELDLTFEFDLAAAMTDAAKAGKAKPIIDAQARVLKCYPPGQYGRFLSNHDQRRIMTTLGDDAGAMRSAAAMLLLGPGVPFIYYGEELGMTGDKPDEKLRTPMQWSGENAAAGFTDTKPWEPLAGDIHRRNVKVESASEASLLTLYRDLIRLRTRTPALSSGAYWPVNCSNDGVYAFIRGDAPDPALAAKDPAFGETDRVSKGEGAKLVVINLSGRAVRDFELHAPASPIHGNFVGIEDAIRPRVRAEPRPVAAIECVPDTGAFRAFTPVPAIEPHEILVFGFANGPAPRR
jgi:glycosidase